LEPNCHGGFYFERALARDAGGDHRGTAQNFDIALRRDPTFIHAYFARSMA
jgi:hypothetical protein